MQDRKPQSRQVVREMVLIPPPHTACSKSDACILETAGIVATGKMQMHQI